MTTLPTTMKTVSTRSLRWAPDAVSLPDAVHHIAFMMHIDCQNDGVHCTIRMAQY